MDIDPNAESLSQPNPDKKAEKASIRDASAKLRTLLRGHLDSRRKGGGVSPLRAMADRIRAKAEAKGETQP